MRRKYDVSDYLKHERPNGWGTLCPKEIEGDDAQLLLDSGVEIDDAIWNVEGRYCFRAFAHRRDGDVSYWHGHPIPWSRLPAKARAQLIESGRLDSTTYRKAIRRSWGVRS